MRGVFNMTEIKTRTFKKEEIAQVFEALSKRGIFFTQRYVWGDVAEIKFSNGARVDIQDTGCGIYEVAFLDEDPVVVPAFLLAGFRFPRGI